jgi:transposase InsO family protein
VDDKQVFSGALVPVDGAEIAPELTAVGSGTRGNGTPYRRFRLQVAVPHAVSTLKVETATAGVKSALGNSVAVDNLSLTLNAPPAQEFQTVIPTAVSADQPVVGAWATREELRIAIVTWIERTYHRRRRQDGVGRLTPIEYETIMTTTADQAA